MATGQRGVCGENAQGAVHAATEPGPGLAATRQLSTAGGPVRGLPWKWSCATCTLARFMEPGALGSLGVPAARVVGKAPRQEQGFAVTPHQPLVAPTVTEQKHRCRFAMKDTVQLMASGQRGPVGVPVPCPVVEVPDRGEGTALTLPPSMEEADVMGVMSRVISAIPTLVPPTVTGALGVAGERAAERATEGRCGGTARATTRVLPTGDELVGARTPRCRGAVLTCVLWTEAGETGTAGARVLPLAEEARRLAGGSATVQHQTKVAIPALGTPLRCPDAMCRRVQVGPHEPEEVSLGVLMMLNLELLSLMPQ